MASSSDEYEVVEYVYEVSDGEEYEEEVVYEEYVYDKENGSGDEEIEYITEEVYVEDNDNNGQIDSWHAPDKTINESSYSDHLSSQYAYTNASVARTSPPITSQFTESTSSSFSTYAPRRKPTGSITLVEAFKTVSGYNTPRKTKSHRDEDEDEDEDDVVSSEEEEGEWEDIETEGTAMKIFIPAIGALGDVLPFVALGTSIQKKGHTVVVGTSLTYRALVTGHGLGWVEIEGDLEHDLVNTDKGKELKKKGFIGSLSRTQELMFPLMNKWFHSIAKHSEDCDMLILTITSLLAGFSAWEKFSDTLAMVMYTYPCTPTKFYAPTQSGGTSTSIFNWLNSIKWVFTDFNFWKFWKGRINTLRKRVYNLPPVTGQFREHLRRVRERPIPFVTTYSAYLYPRPMDWPLNQHLTGSITYHTSEQLESFDPPADMKEFLDNSEDEGVPVYIGFGTMLSTMLSPEDQKKQIDMWVSALEKAHVRGIVAIHGYPHPEHYSNKREELERLHNTFFFDAFIPHAWLFPKCAAVIHHGGAGTTHTILRYGLPSLTVPFGGDQRFNGDRVYKSGIGLAPIPISQLTQERLTEAIIKLTKDTELRKKATAFGCKVRLENGLNRTVEIISRHIERGNSTFSSGLRQKYSPDKWMPDDEASQCCHCKSSFTTFRRKHHCRRCGLVFCQRCCGDFMSLAKGTTATRRRGKVRVCVVCARAVKQEEKQKELEDRGDSVIDDLS